jgi:hypothetical protein
VSKLNQVNHCDFVISSMSLDASKQGSIWIDLYVFIINPCRVLYGDMVNFCMFECNIVNQS